MRLGLLGGTFDPIHCGHLDLASAAERTLGLDRVLFIPAHVPPHRARAPLASGFHRFAMTAIALLGHPRFAASDLELARSGPSFSVDTIRSLQAEGWHPWQLFFISGVDAFAEVDTWQDYPALLDESHFVVISRPGYERERLPGRLPDLASRIVDARENGSLAERLCGPATAIVFIDALTANVSSTDVRRRMIDRESLEGLVPDGVARYIRQHRLYESTSTASQLHGQI